MGSAVAGALISGGLSYLGARNQADAATANAERSEALQREQQDHYRSIVDPGIASAQGVFASDAPAAYVEPQLQAAGYSSGLGQYYADQGIPEYERGRRLEDFDIARARTRADVTPESYAQEQIGLAQAYQNPYTEAVINSTRSGINTDYNQRAQDSARSLARSGQLGSTIAGQRAASIEGARTTALVDAEQSARAQAYDASLDRARSAQESGLSVADTAAGRLGTYGQAAATRGVNLADRAVTAGETAGKLGLSALYAQPREYLSVVQSPTAGTPRVTAVDRPTIDPLTYGAGIGLQSYYDFSE